MGQQKRERKQANERERKRGIGTMKSKRNWGIAANVTHRRGSQDGERDRGGTALAVKSLWKREKNRSEAKETEREKEGERGATLERARGVCAFFSLALLRKVLIVYSFFCCKKRRKK
jgi:hypothetical protein